MMYNFTNIQMQGATHMPFTAKKQVYAARIHAVTLGTGEKRVILGGENVLPFHTFDAPIANRPRIAAEISDRPWDDAGAPALRAFYAGCGTMAERAARAATLPGVDAVCLRFESADPNAGDMPVEECVRLAKEVADAVDVPILVMGCKSPEKDAALFAAVSEALEGRNILILSAREENYRTVGASATLEHNQVVGAESAVDINLAKQLNVLLSQMGVPAESVCMDVGSAAAGYGFEYLASTMDRIRLAALAQSDAQLQMPIVTPVSPETWVVKESTAPEEENPGWGDVEERAIEMEVCTASACLVSGSNMVILRHPEAISAVARFIDSLM